MHWACHRVQLQIGRPAFMVSTGHAVAVTGGSRDRPKKAVRTKVESHKQAPTPARDAARRWGCREGKEAQTAYRI